MFKELIANTGVDTLCITLPRLTVGRTYSTEDMYREECVVNIRNLVVDHFNTVGIAQILAIRSTCLETLSIRGDVTHSGIFDFVLYKFLKAHSSTVKKITLNVTQSTPEGWLPTLDERTAYPVLTDFHAVVRLVTRNGCTTSMFNDVIWAFNGRLILMLCNLLKDRVFENVYISENILIALYDKNYRCRVTGRLVIKRVLTADLSYFYIVMDVFGRSVFTLLD